MQSAKHTSHQKTAGEHFATVVTGRRGCHCGLSPVRLRSRPRSTVGGNLVGDLGNDATDSLSPVLASATAGGRAREAQDRRTPYLYGCQVKSTYSPAIRISANWLARPLSYLAADADRQAS